MKLYLSEYARFKPRDGRGAEGVICTFTPFQCFDEEQEMKVTKGYFLTDHEETIKRLDNHPDKGNGFVDWTGRKPPMMIRGKLIQANHFVMELNQKRLDRISQATGGQVTVQDSHSEPVHVDVKPSFSKEDVLRYGELKGKLLKDDGEIKKTASKDLIEEFKKLKVKLGE